MKKPLIILYSAIVSVFLYSQAVKIDCTLHSIFQVENIMESSVHVEDNCEEDQFTDNIITPFHLPVREYLPKSLFLYTISGITPFVWQPPE